MDLPEVKVAVVIGGTASSRQAKQRWAASAQVGHAGAVLYEIVTADTNEEVRSPPPTRACYQGTRHRRTIAGRILPDRLLGRRTGLYLDYAERLLAVYRNGSGGPAASWTARSGPVFADEPTTAPTPASSLAKLLDDGGTYHRDRGGRGRFAAGGNPRGGPPAPVGPQGRSALQHEEAGRSGRSPPGWAARGSKSSKELFADVIEFHRLTAFEGYPEARCCWRGTTLRRSKQGPVAARCR